jgi:hypothetical protein
MCHNNKLILDDIVVYGQELHIYLLIGLHRKLDINLLPPDILNPNSPQILRHIRKQNPIEHIIEEPDLRHPPLKPLDPDRHTDDNVSPVLTDLDVDAVVVGGQSVEVFAVDCLYGQDLAFKVDRDELLVGDFADVVVKERVGGRGKS